MSDSKTHSEAMVFHGTIVKKDDKYVSTQVFPGFVVDVKTEDVANIEEATDPITKRTYVKIALKEDANIDANFRPRLARLAAESDGVPFVLGGQPQGCVPTNGMPGGGVPSMPPVQDAVGHELFSGNLEAATCAPINVDSLNFLFTTYDTRGASTPFTTPFITNPIRTAGPGGFIVDLNAVDTQQDTSNETLRDLGLFR